jgi:hypothetical protein
MGKRRGNPKEVLRLIAQEAAAGTLRIHSGDEGCSNECEDVCQDHGGCSVEGATFCLCNDGESFVKAG